MKYNHQNLRAVFLWCIMSSSQSIRQLSEIDNLSTSKRIDGIYSIL